MDVYMLQTNDDQYKQFASHFVKEFIRLNWILMCE